ncbi:MAG: FAD-dependent oxidoreductase [Spirochaetaceae bacterium]|nr:FAD-dependent oxidoreductase [Spirochaetaceae bacterium]
MAPKGRVTPSFKPGVYQGRANGNSSEIVVETEFTNDAIRRVTIVSEGETLRVAQPALERIPAAIVETQSLAVDAISTCTVTSYAVIAAVEDCVRQAGGDVAGLSTPLPAAPKKGDTVIQADVVIAGAGLAGLSAALAAVDSGKTVVMFEKNDVAGGSSALSGGFITGIGTGMQREVGYIESVDSYLKFWLDSAGASERRSQADTSAIRSLIERSASDVYFLIDHGVGLHEPNGMGGPELRWHHSDWRKGWQASSPAGGVDHIVRSLQYLSQKPNFTIYYTTPVTGLVTNSQGRVTGVTAKAEDGSTITVQNARNVILATGGFARSEELMKRFCPSFPTEWVNAYPATAVGLTGDGIIMAEKIGAAVYEEGWWIDLAFVAAPGFYRAPFNNSIRSANFIADGNGERLYSTSDPNGVRSIRVDRSIRETGVVWAIVDSSLREASALAEERVDGKNVVKADTLAELAQKTGMNPATFTAAVERYNSMVRNGRDTDMGQTRLTAVGSGPYYAVSGKISTMGSIGGLKTNEDCQVLNTNGQPIPGLFAAGEILNGKYFNQVYVSGCAQLICVDTGRTAGTNASR